MKGGSELFIWVALVGFSVERYIACIFSYVVLDCQSSMLNSLPSNQEYFVFFIQLNGVSIKTMIRVNRYS